MDKVFSIRRQDVKELLIDFRSKSLIRVSTFLKECHDTGIESDASTLKNLLHALFAHLFCEDLYALGYFFLLKSKGLIYVKLLVESHEHAMGFFHLESHDKHHKERFLSVLLERDAIKLLKALNFVAHLEEILLVFRDLLFIVVLLSIHECLYVIHQVREVSEVAHLLSVCLNTLFLFFEASEESLFEALA